MYIHLDDIAKHAGIPRVGGVIDIGSHLGENADYYQEQGAVDLVWIEGNEKLIHKLDQELMGKPFKTSLIYPVVLSDEDHEPVEFARTDDNEVSSSILKPTRTLKETAGTHVFKKLEMRARRFDRFYREHIAELDLDKYQLINVNTNGSELKVLRGFGHLLEMFSIPAVLVPVYSLHFFEGQPLENEFTEYLGEQGYRLNLKVETDKPYELLLYTRRG